MSVTVQCGECGLKWNAEPAEWCPRCEVESLRGMFKEVRKLSNFQRKHWPIDMSVQIKAIAGLALRGKK